MTRLLDDSEEDPFADPFTGQKLASALSFQVARED